VPETTCPPLLPSHTFGVAGGESRYTTSSSPSALGIDAAVEPVVAASGMRARWTTTPTDRSADRC